MSDKSNKSIDNAEEIIERFGGIRPMAQKASIPVTTIQGWKKRGAIPVSRKNAILEAAAAHNVKIADLIAEDVRAKQNDTRDTDFDVTNNQDSESAIDNSPAQQPVIELQEQSCDEHENTQRDQHGSGACFGTQTNGAVQDENIEDLIKAIEGRAVRKSSLIAGGLIVILIVALGVLLLPAYDDGEMRQKELELAKSKIAQLEGRLASVSDDVQGVEKKQSYLQGLLPQDWGKEIETLRTQAESLQAQGAVLQEQVQVAMDKVSEVTNEVTAPDAGTLQERVQILETRLAEVAQSEQMQAFYNNLNALQGSIPGQSLIGKSSGELSEFVSSFSGTPDQLALYLDQARQSSSVLQETFEGVPAEEMQAASLLFAMSQVRSALGREQEPFSDDLVLLKNLIGDDETRQPLLQAIDTLAPHAESGVLTINGLTKEFQGLANDAVMASLKGEDVSLQEKASARLNSLLSVEKDGALITGTETQAVLAKTDAYLKAGELEKAVNSAEMLDEPAKEALGRWLSDAKASLEVQAAQDVIERALIPAVDIDGALAQ